MISKRDIMYSSPFRIDSFQANSCRDALDDTVLIRSQARATPAGTDLWDLFEDRIVVTNRCTMFRASYMNGSTGQNISRTPVRRRRRAVAPSGARICLAIRFAFSTLR